MIRACVIAAYCAALVLFEIAARVSVHGAAMMLASFAILSVAGIVFLRQLVPTIESRLCILALGPVVGLVFGRYCLLLTGLALGPSFVSAAAGHVIVAGIATLLVACRARPLPPSHSEDPHELNWILGISAAVLLAMAISYWGEGSLTAKGYAFVPYFPWDLFNHIACTAELARSVPPQNPYFAGQPLHYYWFYHLWPAAIVNLSGATARDGLILSLPAAVFVFVGTLSCVVRQYMPKAAPRYLAIGLGLFAFSYIGILYAAKTASPYLVRYLPSNTLNAYFSFLSHSWFRDFLYEPHALTALTCVLVAIFFHNTSRAHPDWGASLFLGLFLGSAASADLFVGMIGLAWFGATNLGSFLRESGRRATILLSLLAATGVIAGAFALRVFPLGSGALHLGIHPMAKYGPLYLLVELGPIFVFGAIGIYLSLRRGNIAGYHSMLLLMLIGLVLAFTVMVPLGPSLVLRKSIKVVQVPLIIFAAVACAGYLDLHPRHWLRFAAVPIILAGFLTLVTDLRQYLDLETNRTPEIVYISRQRMQALDWLRTRTPRDAIVQLLDEVRPGQPIKQKYDISIPAIGERRTLFNSEYPYVLHVDENDRENRKSILEEVFASCDAASLRRNLRRLPPHYIFVDASAPGPLASLRELRASGSLEQVFQAGEYSVLLTTGK
jgi:hypothetical protein